MKEKKLFYRKNKDNTYALIKDNPLDTPIMQGSIEEILYSSINTVKNSSHFPQVNFVNKTNFSAKEMELIANAAEGCSYMSMGLEDSHRLRTHTFKLEGSSFSFVNYKTEQYTFNDAIVMMYGFVKDAKTLLKTQDEQEEEKLHIKPVFDSNFDDLTKEIITCLSIGTEQRFYRVGSHEERKH
jgi:hypothetical protein